MEITLDTLINLLGLFIGTSGGAFFTWRWMRRKAKAEAETEEVNMAQRVQDTYQEMLEDKQKEVDDNRHLIDELRQDRDHYKKDRDELRGELEKLTRQFFEFKTDNEREMMAMRMDIARNGRMVECMRHLLCGREGCAIRVPVTISAAGEVERTERPEVKDIEPYDDREDA